MGSKSWSPRKAWAETATCREQGWGKQAPEDLLVYARSCTFHMTHPPPLPRHTQVHRGKNEHDGLWSG
eukprot:1161837-Pelagomonas_calceolata.AAC.10